MLVDLREARELDLLCDLCIVGAGIAALSVAREFLGSATEIVVLESGGRAYDEAAQAFNDGANTALDYYDLRYARLRRIGGTINIWGGRCAPLNAIDFRRRHWVPHSGWPIGPADLDPYYRRTHRMLGLGSYVYDEAGWQALGLQPPPLDPGRVRTDFWYLSPESGFRLAEASDLEAAQNVRLVIHATALRLEGDAGGGAIRGVAIGDTSGARGRVRARRYVLACGGIENPRLLLASGGIGNAHDQVGRYFMEHPHARAGRVVAGDAARVWSWYRRRVFPGGAAAAPILRPAEALQEREGILNTAMTIKYQRWPEAGLPASKVLHAWARHQKAPDRLGLLMLRTYKRLDAWADRYLAGPVRRAQLRLGRGGLFLIARVEQAPDPDSRVRLSERERDALGMPRVELSWRIGEQDKRTMLCFSQTLGAELERLELGTVSIEEWLLDDSLELPWDETVSNNPIAGYHHMGTTRMSGTPREGVVDADCRVHGYDNLYVAGSSTFSTSGWANPTFTLVALALRLAAHLRTELARSGDQGLRDA